MREAAERAAVNDMLGSLPWSVDAVFSWRHSRQINLLETETCRRWEESFSPSRDLRPLDMLDSRVTLCSSG